MERSSCGKWASRMFRSQLFVEDGHRAGVEGALPPLPRRSGDEGFQEGARGLPPSAKELYTFYQKLMSRSLPLSYTPL